jgi:hypothetical protein
VLGFMNLIIKGENMKNIFIVLITVFVLSGCGRYTTLQTGVEKVDLNNTGVVIVSAEETKESIFSYYTFFFFDNKSNNEGGTLDTTKKNDFKGNSDSRGGVFVFSLPKGSYEFNDWLVYNGVAEFKPRNPKKAVFNVEPGTITYLGNLNMNLVEDENFFGMSMVFGGIPEVRNMFDRDIPIAEANYPFLNTMEVSKNILMYE